RTTCIEISAAGCSPTRRFQAASVRPPEIERLDVRWPSGHIDRLEHIPANGIVRITEGGRSERTPFGQNDQFITKERTRRTPRETFSPNIQIDVLLYSRRARRSTEWPRAFTV